MRKLLFPVMVILMLVTGCTCSSPVGNQLPVAYIDSISHEEVSFGEVVTFTGHGTDVDGEVVGYEWRSDLDGVLSAMAIFESSSLSEGEHTISFKVQDNSGSWSEDLMSVVSVSVNENGAPIINSFAANPVNIASGEFSLLNWDVSGAATVNIDQGIGDVASVGSVVVSPATTTIYALTATNDAGNDIARIRVIVSESESSGLPSINFFTANPGIITSGESSTLSWSVSNATAVGIDQGVGNVSSTGSTSVSPITITDYTLTATNAIGWASVTIQVIVEGGDEEQADATPPGIPVLVSPADGVVLPQPIEPWAFDWSDSSDPESGVNQYQICVERAGATLSFIDEMVAASDYSVTSGGVIIESKCTDWRWMVRAQNNDGLWSDWSPMRSFDVEPPPPEEYTVTLLPTFADSGYIRDDGQVIPATSKHVLVGDDENDHSIQGFMSFDISCIPAGATISEVIVDFSTVYSIEGNPFDDLGCLRIYVQDYDTLDAGDYFMGDPIGALLRYCAADQIMAEEVVSESDPNVFDALQARIGNPKFQLRLQIREKATDNNGDDDYIDWKVTVPDEPKLIVTYIIP